MRYNFSPEQIERIKAAYPDNSNPDLVTQFGVTLSWLEAFASRNRLRKSDGRRYPDISSGTEIGDLLVLRKTDKRQKNNVMYECQCKCGAIFLARSHLLRREKVKACSKCTFRVGENHHNRGGLGPIGGTIWSKIKSHAHERGIPFHLSIEEAVSLYEQQGRKCALSGVPIEFSKRFKDYQSATSASLDRIDNDGIYEIGNVRWVHKEVNFMMHKLSNDRFLFLCQQVVANFQSKEPCA